MVFQCTVRYQLLVYKEFIPYMTQYFKVFIISSEYDLRYFTDLLFINIKFDEKY